MQSSREAAIVPSQPKPDGAGTAPASGPGHVAIIMDGNRRWAVGRGLHRSFGHKKGAERVRKVVEAAVDAKVQILTLYAFSSENWQRPQDEVRDLMGLLRLYLHNEVEALHKEGVRLLVIGRRDRLAADIVRLIVKSEARTAKNTVMTLVIALDYSAQDEIAAAAQALAADVAAGRMAASEITSAALETRLFTAHLPPPDLIIRTSGEQRLSNFMLWQAAYSELVFVDTLWPDFTPKTFMEALDTYRGRQRRFGRQ